MILARRTLLHKWGGATCPDQYFEIHASVDDCAMYFFDIVVLGGALSDKLLQQAHSPRFARPRM